MKGRIKYLDGLRGIAALVVVLQHTLETIFIATPLETRQEYLIFFNSFNAGRFGVALFFLISGFVVPFSIKRPRPIYHFTMSRFLRLYPAYWLSLALALVVFPRLTERTYSFAQIFANVTMFQSLVGERDVIGVYWTLIIELIFYVLCAGLFLIHRLTNIRILITAIVAGLCLSLAIATYASFRGSHFPANVPLNLALMFLGTLMRRAWVEQDLQAKRFLPSTIVIWIIIMPVVQYLTPPQTEIMPITPLSFCMAYWLAIGTFLATAKLNRLTGPVFIALGAISYSMYLFHTICIEIMFHLFRPRNIWQDAAFVVGALFSTIILASLVYILVERPAILIARWSAKLPQGSRTRSHW